MKDFLEKLENAITLFIVFTFIGIIIFWNIYAFVKYGNKPIDEIPGWALWFMFGGNS